MRHEKRQGKAELKAAQKAAKAELDDISYQFSVLSTRLEQLRIAQQPRVCKRVRDTLRCSALDATGLSARITRVVVTGDYLDADDDQVPAGRGGPQAVRPKRRPRRKR